MRLYQIWYIFGTGSPGSCGCRLRIALRPVTSDSANAAGPVGRPGASDPGGWSAEVGPSDPLTSAPPVAPLDVDGVKVATWGTALWAIAGLTLLIFFRSALAERGSSWWLLVCGAGVLIGIAMTAYTRRRRAVYARGIGTRRTEAAGDPPQSAV